MVSDHLNPFSSYWFCWFFSAYQIFMQKLSEDDRVRQSLRHFLFCLGEILAACLSNRSDFLPFCLLF